jgi:hypothetical protein
MKFSRLADRAKQVIDQRGGTDALKGDVTELREIAKRKGSARDKAKAAVDALKEPGRSSSSRSHPRTDPTTDHARDAA